MALLSKYAELLCHSDDQIVHVLRTLSNTSREGGGHQLGPAGGAGHVAAGAQGHVAARAQGGV